MSPAMPSLAAMLQGKRVLDAGCGTGYGSAELAQSAAEVTGVDIAADAIEYASANYPLRRSAVSRIVLHGSSLPAGIVRSFSSRSK